MDKLTEITNMLGEWNDGAEASEALNQILPVVYDELHRQALRHLRRKRLNHTIQATDLVNDAFCDRFEKLSSYEKIFYAYRAGICFNR